MPLHAVRCFSSASSWNRNVGGGWFGHFDQEVSRHVVFGSNADCDFAIRPGSDHGASDGNSNFARALRLRPVECRPFTAANRLSPLGGAATDLRALSRLSSGEEVRTPKY